jgi:hypothetical protein
LDRVVVPLAVILLVGLFALERRGTGVIGRLFGPVMAGWFAVIGVLGAAEVVRAPEILRALNPWDGLRFLLAHGVSGFLVLGAVVLAVTGAEALYADMGHFGKRPIRLAWFVVVFGTPAQLFRTRGSSAPRSERGKPVYHLAPKLLSPRGPRHRGDRYRFTSVDFDAFSRRAGDQSRVQSAVRILPRPPRPLARLHPFVSALAVLQPRARARVSIIDCAGRRLRNRRYGHHGRDDPLFVLARTRWWSD